MKRLCHMADLDVRTPLQVGDRSSHSQDSVASPGAQRVALDRASEQCLPARIQRALASNFTRTEIRVAGRYARIRIDHALGAVQRPVPCLQDACTPLGGRTVGRGLGAKICPVHGGNLDPEIETITQRATDARLVPADHPGIAGAATGR